jgi:hypothetical protein
MQTREEIPMTNRFLVSVAAIALIAGASAANAQSGMNREGGGAATQQSSPQSGGPSTGGSSTGATTQKSTEPSGMKSTQSEREKSTGAAKGQQAEDKAAGQKSKSQSTENEPKSGAKAEGREGHDKNMKAEDREGQEKNMKAEGREGQQKNMNAQGREGRESAQTPTNERTQSTTGQAGAGAKLSTEQRTKIVDVIRREHVEAVNNVDFAISVGTRVPRERVHLRPLPSDVVTVYPEWRGYEFFLVRDQIVVVDPRTGEIVDVLPA